MNTKYLALSFILGIALGYWLMPKKEITKTVEKQVDRVVTVIKRPDGTVEKVITDKSKISEASSEKTGLQAEDLAVSALLGTDFKGGQYYGVHAAKPILGPVTVGAYGLVGPSLIAGASVGFNF